MRGVSPRVLVVGELHPWSLGSSFVRAFRELGIAVETFDLAKELKRSWPLSGVRGFRRIGDAFSLAINLRFLLRRRNSYDLILVVKGDMIYGSTLRRIKEWNPHVAMFNYNSDDPWRIPGASSRHVVESIPLYDAYFIFGKHLVEPIRMAGCRKVFWLPFAYDPHLHPCVALQPDDYACYRSEISFVGNYGNDQERAEFLMPLSRFDLRIWGNDWDKLPKTHPLRAKWAGRPIYGIEFTKVCRASKINLNHVRKKNLGEGTTMRSFEITGCGGFMLSNYTEELGEIFKEGEEVAFFQDANDLVDKVRFYLSNEDLRVRAATRVRQMVLKSHCCSHRVKTIMDVFENL